MTTNIMTTNIMKQPLVYFGTSKSQNGGKDIKIGKTSILHNRKNGLDTSYSRDGFKFIKLILCKSAEQEKEIEKFLHSEFMIIQQLI